MGSRLDGPKPMRPLPSWVPQAAERYLLHVETGLSIRAVTRASGCHASTILRQIRRCELRRDDPLVDEALVRLGRRHFKTKNSSHHQETVSMSPQSGNSARHTDEAKLQHEGLRILRRLCETGAILAVAMDMDKAAVVRKLPGGMSTRTAVVDRNIAEAMALKEWIACADPGRISRYRVTPAGRTALKQFLGGYDQQNGMAEAQARFVGQGETAEFAAQNDEPNGANRLAHHCLAESPLAALARRKDKAGNPFLTDDLVAVGEQLREDFELAQMGPRITQNWEIFLTQGSGATPPRESLNGAGPAAAKARVSSALSDLGPGLGDIVLRCCCYLEGMELAEQHMGWSARSGKIVLRIGLQRLKRHYDAIVGPHGPLIG